MESGILQILDKIASLMCIQVHTQEGNTLYQAFARFPLAVASVNGHFTNC